MSKPAAPPLPERVTSGQLARLIGVTERVIAGRRLDGRLPTDGAAIDFVTLVRRGMNAGRGRVSEEQLDEEAWTLASWAASCAAAAVVSPRCGETPEQAAMRGLRYALAGDDYFPEPPGWKWPEQLTLSDVIEAMAEDDAEEPAEASPAARGA